MGILAEGATWAGGRVLATDAGHCHACSQKGCQLCVDGPCDPCDTCGLAVRPRGDQEGWGLDEKWARLEPEDAWREGVWRAACACRRHHRATAWHRVPSGSICGHGQGPYIVCQRGGLCAIRCERPTNP